MRQLFDRPVFEVGEVCYRWGDVVLCAMLTGEWAPLALEVHQGLACVRHAETSGVPEPEEAIDEFAAEFRYSRELITADETEAWLEARGLDANAWMDWVRREVLRREWSADLPELSSLYPVTAADVASAVPADLLCGERGQHLMEALASRVAAARAGEERGDQFDGQLSRESAEAIIAQLPDIDPSTARQRLASLARLEQGYQRFRAQAPTPELIHRELELGRLEWIRLTCRMIQFETETLAREARLCVEEDGLAVDEVARNARAEVQEVRFYLGELDPDLRPKLLAAGPGDLVGPVEYQGSQTLFLVADKSLPDENSPELRQQIEGRAVDRAVAEQVNRLVRWLEP